MNDEVGIAVIIAVSAALVPTAITNKFVTNRPAYNASFLFLPASINVSATLFVSDLHLCPSRPQTVRRFLAFLEAEASGSEALYILGDLFEYWAGDDDLADPFNAAVCSALKRRSSSGPKVFFLPGNRDFLIGDGFAVAAGATLLDEPYLVTIAGVATLLVHGDTLCTDDADYQNFRRQIRSPAWRQAFLAQPLAERKAQIELLRSASESEKSKKSMTLMDANADAVAALLRQHGLPPRLIHGHTHRPAQHMHRIDGQQCERWVLAAWDDAPAYLSIDSAGCRPLPVNA
jgi:UDP-2,3-diacylglucosamine hydrolase